MRLAAAIGVIAVALAVGIYLHERHVTLLIRGHCTYESFGKAPHCVRTVNPRFHPSWEDPLAVLLAIGGIAVAARILTAPRNLAKPS